MGIQPKDWRMRTLVLLATLSLALAAVHPRGSLPSGWAQSEVLQLSPKPVTLTLFLNDNALGLELVKKHALEASNPRSLKYGQYLSIEEIARLTAPSDIAVEAVTQWLANSLPATAITQRASTLEVKCSLAQAEALFNTQFGMLYNNNTRQAVVRAGDFTLPEHLEKHVAAVFGLHGLPLPPRRLSASNGAIPGKSPAVTPEILAKQYGITGVIPKADTKNSQAVAEFQYQTMNPADLSQFFAQFVTGYKVGVDDVVSKFVGDPNQNYGELEASLDIQIMMGVSPGIKSEFWYFSTGDVCGDFANWTTTILTTKDSPLVHSFSYGFQQPIPGPGPCNAAKVKVIDDNLAKLAANGRSIIMASGDDGSAPGGPDGNFGDKLFPEWPASSGWVTAVGATRFVDHKVGQPEMASDAIGSGGGFSTMFSIANESQYQAADVANYFKVAPQLPPAATFPKTGRGTPDVSALGEAYTGVINGDLSYDNSGTPDVDLPKRRCLH